MQRNIFLEQYYEKKPLIIQRADDTYYDPVIRAEDIVAGFGKTRAVYPFVMAVKSGALVEEELFTDLVKQGADHSFEFINGAKLAAQFLENQATIVMHQTQHTIAKLQEFSNSLAKEFGHAIRVNIYMTPPYSEGLGTHFDNHDAFIIQIAGSKHWKVYSKPYPLPYRGEKDSAILGNLAERECLIDEELEQGGVLFLPRGYIHQVHTNDKSSIHLTVSVQITRNKQLLDAILDENKGDEFQRKAVPVHLHQANDLEDYKTALKAYLCQLVDEKLEAQLDELRERITETDRQEKLTRLLDAFKKQASVDE